LAHLVFSTKNRQPWIDIEIEEDLRRYLAGTCRDIKCPSHKIGGSDDHLHIACTLARTMVHLALGCHISAFQADIVSLSIALARADDHPQPHRKQRRGD
jgi:hypothetical protein